MSIRKLRAGRVPAVTADQYVGEHGTIFWDEGTGTLHLSDGVTPGGYLLSVQTFTTENVPAHPADGNLWFDGESGKLYIWYDSTWVDTNPEYILQKASSSRLGGIKIGQGLTIDQSGVVTIDTAGLTFSFGDFTASANNLSTVNPDENINLVSNGTGAINAVGNFHVHSTAGGLTDDPVLVVDADGISLANAGTGILFASGDRQTEPFLPTALPHPLLPADDNITDLGDPDHRFRNLYLGPASLFMADTITDANIELKVTNGTLYINGAQNLAVGNLVILDTTLKTLTPDLDINIGEATDTGLATIGRQTVITTPNLGSQTAALLINGTQVSPVEVSPLTFDGTMIHTVAQVGQSARIVQDAYGQNNYPIYVGRMARGTIASPTASSTGDILLRLSGNGYGSNGFGSGGTARIDFTAVEPYTNSAKGSRIDFWTTPAGTTAITNNASVDSTGFKGNGYTFTEDGTRQTTAGIPLTEKKITNAPYVATLDSTGKLDPTQIPDSLTGAIVFKGVWNATTNTPTLSDSLPAGLDIGWEYIVEVGGTRDIGDGSKTFLAGDFVIYDGTHWKQVPSGNAFVSLTSGGHITVNQTTGAMTLGSDATPNSTVSTIVSRDSSGNFAANVITANLSGNVTGTVSGNAGTVTNGVYTVGNQSIDGTKTFTSTIQGSITGNAGTVTNGVVTTGSYSDPSWLTISKSKVGLSNVDNTADANKNVLYATTAGGAPATDVYAWAKAATKPSYTKSEVGLGSVENTALSTSTYYIGTTQNTYNRASASQTLTGVSIDGNAGTVTNGVYTTGSYSDPSWLTISATKVGLGNVTNESKATMFTSPTFTGTVVGVTKAMVGLGSVDNTADASKNVLYATTAGGAPATDVYAWAKAATKPTYTKSEVGLSAVENTALSTWAGSTNITTVGTLGSLSVTATITGSVSGNAGTVTNGVYTSGSYSDPSWLTISKSKVGLSAVENTALSTWAGTSNITTVGTLTSGTIGSGFTAIANARLANSTISGVALGGTLGALTVGYGLQLESGTTYDGSAAHTISNVHAVTGPVTVTGNAYSLDLGTCNGVVILNNVSQANYTVTITGTPIAGKVVRLLCLNLKTGAGATTVTVSGLTAANSSNGTASFQGNANNSVAMVEFVCTTAALSGVYMNTGGAK